MFPEWVPVKARQFGGLASRYVWHGSPRDNLTAGQPDGQGDGDSDNGSQQPRSDAQDRQRQPVHALVGLVDAPVGLVNAPVGLPQPFPQPFLQAGLTGFKVALSFLQPSQGPPQFGCCLLYTSDAADE